MDIKTWIKTGDRVELTLGDKSFNTMVEEFTEEDVISISPPIQNQQMLLPEREQVYSLHRTDKRGLIVLDVRVLGVDYGDNIPLVKMAVVSGPKKVQRRKSYRADIMLDVAIRKTGADETRGEEDAAENTKTLNISEDGMLYVTDVDYDIGEIIECDIDLNRFDMNCRLQGIKARVTRRDGSDGGRLKVAVNFTECSRKDRNQLLKFIACSQRK